MLIINFLTNLFNLYYCNSIIMSDVIKIDRLNYIIDSDSKSNEGFIGFFDWLRIDVNTIVGIRLCFFENQWYNDFLIKLAYVVPTFENKCIEVLFEEYTYDSNLSGDQDFTNNYVYKSQKGEYLFTFGLDHLSEGELNSLLKYCKVLTEKDLTESR